LSGAEAQATDVLVEAGRERLIAAGALAEPQGREDRCGVRHEPALCELERGERRQSHCRPSMASSTGTEAASATRSDAGPDRAPVGDRPFGFCAQERGIRGLVLRIRQRIEDCKVDRRQEISERSERQADFGRRRPA